MIGSRQLPLFESVVRFFSYFTILTNLIVAIFFSMQMLKKNQTNHFFLLSETSLSVTVYILVVGLIYQFILSKLYHPQGLNLLADNIIHGFTPIATLIFWLFYESRRKIRFATILYWLLYPLIYLVYTLFRGSIIQFYPYPFVDIIKYGMPQVLINSFFVMLLFLFLFIGLGGLANIRSKKA